MGLIIASISLVSAGAASAQYAQGYQPQVQQPNGQYRYMSPSYNGLDPNKDDLVGMADIVGEVVSRRCTTQACFNAEAKIDRGHLGRAAVNPNAPRNVVACVRANDDFGREISRLGNNLTRNEASNGGTLSYEKAEQVRSLLFSETYFVRRALRTIISEGDASQCMALRDQGINIMHEIVRTRL